MRFVAARNILKAWLLLAGICGALGLVGWELDGFRLLSIFVFCGLLLVTGAYWTFDRVVLGMVGARELPIAEAPLLHSTVERLAAIAGVMKPRLYLIPNGLPLALATGRGPRSSSLAVSAGCVSACTPAELEGVLAHELAHVRHRDVALQTAVVVLAASIVELSRIGGWLERALLFVLGPVAAACVHVLLSPKREFEADRTAAQLCDSPHGLADALQRLEQAAELVEFRGSPATEPLYPFNPFLEEGLAALFVTHPPVGERVRRLRALDAGLKTQAA
ncbi:MAG TPA: M48 family metalloprotease [Gaiellaceae bacterium]|jgi:heat shock protein HtpX|nr:M48 family metalloprotease [Gaiellaceae bacterium]